MIATIIPVKRLPAALGMFTYHVPKHLETTIAVGQLVIIPFRSTSIFGIVFSVSISHETEVSSADIKPLERIVHEIPILSPEGVAHIPEWSTWYHLSPGTLTKMMLPPLHKRKIEHVTLTPLQAQRTKKPSAHIPIYHYYKHSQEHADTLHRSIQGITVILVPEIHHIHEVYASLSPELQNKSILWHSHLSPKEQFAAWFVWRNQEKTILIGTRSALLLPITHVDTIIVDYEHDEQHKQWDQAPRFHVHDLATLLASAHNIDLHFMSFSPSIESYFSIYEHHFSLPQKQLTKQDRFFSEDTLPVTCIDMHEERRAGRYTVFSDAAKDALRESTGDIYLFIQRRGFSTAVGCNSCGRLETCPTCTLPLIFHEEKRVLQCHYCHYEKPMITTCSNCHAPNVELRGAGTEFVESGIRKFFGDRQDVSIHRIDGDTDEPVFEETSTRRIIIGTDMAFRFVRWDKTDYILFVDIDKQLQRPEYRATEHVWHTIQEVRYRKTPQARFDVQTFTRDHVLFKSLQEPDRLYRTELNSRKLLQYPPYTYLARFFIGQSDEATAEHEANRVYTHLHDSLTKTKKSIILHNPIAMQPLYFRQQFWYVIIAKLSSERWTEDLSWLASKIPGNWKIDPHPITLLTP